MIKSKRLAAILGLCSVCVLTVGGTIREEALAQEVCAASVQNVLAVSSVQDIQENEEFTGGVTAADVDALPVSLAKEIGAVCRSRCQDKQAEVAAEIQRQEEAKAAEEARKAQEAKAAQEAQAASAQVQASSDVQALMASIIYCEAGNQSYEGQVAVGAVIMNRVRSGQFPNTVEGVIYQAGQFGPVSTGWLDKVRSTGGYTDSAMQAAADALAGANPIGNCLYFDQGGYGMQIGAHYFH